MDVTPPGKSACAGEALPGGPEEPLRLPAETEPGLAPAEATPEVAAPRRPARSMLVYSAGILASKLASVILVPLYTHRLTQAQYGTLELLDVTIQAASKLMWEGLPFAFWYFYTQRNPGRDRNRVVSTGALGALGVGSAGALLGMALAPQISALLWGSARNALLVRISFAGLASAYPLEILIAWLRIIDAPVKCVASGIGRLVVQTAGAVVLLVVCGMGIAGVLWSSLLAGSALAVVLLVYTLSRTGLAFEPRLFGRMLAYATPSIFVGLCSFLIHFGDRYFLVRYVPLSELAIYSLAYKFGMLITLMQYAFQGYWNAQVFHIAKGPTSGEVLGRALTYLTLALCGATVAITAFVKPALRLVAPPSYEASAPLVPLICAGYVAFGLSSYFQTLFYVRKRTASDAIVNGAGALVVGVAYAALIPRYHLWGAAAATLLGFVATLAIGGWWSGRFITFDREWGRLLKVAAASATMVAVSLCLPLHSIYAQIGVGALVVLAYPALLYATGFFDQSERRQLREWLRRARLATGLAADR
jgi:O-antigen/teichoic acid export membrane protein